MQRRQLIQGTTPLLISMPHIGIFLPPDLKARMTPEALALPDTDWHVDKLYWFARDMGIGLLMATHSRYLIDLNRPQDDAELYPGQLKTGLCPLETFAGEPIYIKDQEPDELEKLNRVASYWLPYHETLTEELRRLKERHGYALLLDAHSIRSEVPRLFEGRLWDLNLGSARGVSCAKGMAEAALAAAGSGFYSAMLDKRFVGGHITRFYGKPADNVHALQLELTWRNYMNEDPPYVYVKEKAEGLQAVLRKILTAILDWGKAHGAKN
jgi:N-formylglutamate deformylase